MGLEFFLISTLLILLYASHYVHPKQKKAISAFFLFLTLNMPAQPNRS